MHAVLRVLRAGLDPELLHRIGKRQRQVQAVVRVVVHRAVEQVRHAERLAAGDRDAAARACRLAARPGLPVSTARAGEHDRALPTLRPSSGSASTASLSMTAPIAGLRVSTSGAAASTVTVSSSAPSAAHRDHRIAVDLQDDAGLHVGPESRQRRFEAIRVRSAGSAACTIQSRRSPPSRRKPVSVCVSRHRHARQRASACIDDGAVDLRRRRGLRRCGPERREGSECANEQYAGDGVIAISPSGEGERRWGR